MIDQWLTPTQAGRRLELSAERVRQLTAVGRLTRVRTPLGCLVDVRRELGVAEAELRRAEASAAG